MFNMDLNLKQRLHYSPAEREYLKKLVIKYKDIVENTEADGVSNRKKSQAWIEIQQEYNSVETHTPRTVKQLKKAWDNQKTRMKYLLAKQQEAVNSGRVPPGLKDDIQIPSDEYVNVITEHIGEKATVSDTIRLSNNGSYSSNDSNLVTVTVPPLDFQECYYVENPENEMDDIEESVEPPPRVVLERPRRIIRTSARPPPRTRWFTKYISARREVDPQVPRLKRQVGSDETVNNLIKKELETQILVTELEKQKREIEKEKAQLDLQMKKEELAYKRKVWEMELEILTKSLKE